MTPLTKFSAVTGMVIASWVLLVAFVLAVMEGL